MKLDDKKVRLIRVIVGAALLAGGFVFEARSEVVCGVLCALSLLVVGADVVFDAVRNLFRGRMLDENLLMTIASIGAFAIKNFTEGAAVMLFFQVGELFQSYAVDNSRRSIEGLMSIRPDHANVLRDGELSEAAPESVAVGELIVIRPGERVPLDAEVTEGVSMLDTSALTGESVPRSAKAGDCILSGSVNLSGALTARVTSVYGESTVSRMLELVENASEKKSSSEAFITKFARVYTPIVVGAALLLAVLPPLLISGAKFADWGYRALVFLVISCPCALVISVPLTFFGGIGGASKRGILVKGGNYFEALARAETVVMDKTGTLTEGTFKVTSAEPVRMSEKELISLAAHAESLSSHPIALSLREAAGAPDGGAVSDVVELAGYGVSANVDGKTVLAGNARLMEREGIAVPELPKHHGTAVYVALDGAFAGRIIISDTVKSDAKFAVGELKRLGVKKTVMLTGDSASAGEAVANEVGIDAAYCELLPADKVAKVETLLGETSRRGTLVFVGDGINDAPALARGDVGVAMGALGSDAAIEAADVVIMTDEPKKLAEAVKIARKTLRIARQNIVFALAVKAAVLLLGALGIASMWAAVFADVGTAVLAILNAARMLRPMK